MPQQTTIGRLLISAALPAEMRGRDGVLDKKGIAALLQEVADKHPEEYRTVAQQLSNVGRDAAFTTGGYTFGLKALRQSLAARKMRLELGAKLRDIYAADTPDDEKERQILSTVGSYQQHLSKGVMAESLAENNPLALQAKSGARGNAMNVNSLRGADLLYTDHRGKAMPIPVLRSYAMGLKPYEYFAGAFGARKGILDLKHATQDAGYLAKQLTQAVHRLLVSQNDSEDEPDPETPRGLPVDTSDPDSEGALLAHPVGGYTRNTLLTPKILKELRASGVDQILVRSPAVGGPLDGGVYARDVGVRERGRMAPIGDYVGIAGAQSLAAPITQAQISSKHCLARGTRVRMADGTTKPIEMIIAGETVLGADKRGNTFPVRVVNVYDNGPRECVRTVFRVMYAPSKENITLVSTADHRVLLTHGRGKSLTEGACGRNELLPVGVDDTRYRAVRTNNTSADDNNPPEAMFARQKPKAIGPCPTHDIEVDHPDHLFVLANGLIVSNSGGVAGASAGAITGFQAINQLIQVPKVFQGGASHAQLDGRVTEIRPAPQGGQYVKIDGKDHYVAQGAALKVQRGDTIEAGDVLSAGTPNPAEIVKHKGIGEGRRYFVQAFRDALADSNTYGNRRNIELLSRGLINHVRLTDEMGDWSPDDVVPYQVLESQWQPRAGHVVVPPTQASGYYLERPVLHYSVGTRIQPSMLPLLQKHGVPRVYAHRDPPPFEPEMIRGMANVAHDPDWMVNMLGSYQKGSLLDATHRGAVSDESGSSFVPALARGEGFGRTGLTKGWQADDTAQ